MRLFRSLVRFLSDAFDGVFQPCMGLLSTRLAPAAPRAAEAASWPLARSDLDVVSRRLLERLGALPPLPAALFGERGVIDLTGLCGYYSFLAMMMNVARTPAPADTKGVPSLARFPS